MLHTFEDITATHIPAELLKSTTSCNCLNPSGSKPLRFRALIRLVVEVEFTATAATALLALKEAGQHACLVVASHK